MLDWSTDDKGRWIATDPRSSMRYRISGTSPCELAVLPHGSRRSCDRSSHPTLEAAMHHAERRVEHQAELEALGRVRRQTRSKTPWGASRSSIDHGGGIVLHSTPEQDGFHLTAEANADMPKELRLADGWYQDDGDSARVVLGHPERFTALEFDDALEAAVQAFPEKFAAWEARLASEAEHGNGPAAKDFA